MKLRHSLTFASTLLLLSASAQAKEEQREVSDFHGVAVSHCIRAEVKPGPKSVRLVGDEKKLSRIRTVVEDGVLRMKVERQGLWSDSMDGVRLIVTNPRIESVASSGGSHVDVEATAAETFTVAASGGTEINITGVEAKQVEVTASGGTEVSLKGRASQVKVTANGGSKVEARDMRIEALEVQVSGGSRFEAHSAQRVTGALSGGSTVRLKEQPANTQVSTSSGSKVVYE